jgi:hypothetical protein
VAPASIQRYFVSGSFYSVVQSTDGFEVSKDDELLFATDQPVEIRHVEFVGEQVRFEVRANKPVKIRVTKNRPRDFPAGLSRT